MDLLSLTATIVSAVLACTSLVSYLLYRNASRRIKDAEAELAEAKADTARWERYEKQLDHAAKTIEILHKQVEADAQRLADDQKALNDKTDRIRELTDKSLATEEALNVANHRITRVTEERDHERLEKERYREWHCRSSICKEGIPDPKGRQPPNPRILGKKFTLRDLRTADKAAPDEKNAPDEKIIPKRQPDNDNP